jgi:hypothetical protein
MEVSDPHSIWTVYVLAGVIFWLALPALLPVGSFGVLSIILLLCATPAATVYAVKTAQAKRYKLFRLAFDMSSGNVTAFETRDESEALRMRDDIVKGLETGALPDYLRSHP